MEKKPKFAKHIETIGRELEELRKQGVMDSYFVSFMLNLSN